MWFAENQIGAPYIMRLMAPPSQSEAMKSAAARLIQTTWRHRQAVRERDCIAILTKLKFTVVNEETKTGWFMDRMLRTV
jgi:hypothetical protein